VGDIESRGCRVRTRSGAWRGPASRGRVDFEDEGRSIIPTWSLDRVFKARREELKKKARVASRIKQEFSFRLNLIKPR